MGALPGVAEYHEQRRKTSCNVRPVTLTIEVDKSLASAAICLAIFAMRGVCAARCVEPSEEASGTNHTADGGVAVWIRPDFHPRGGANWFDHH